jgi:hypothetical protein
VSPPAVVAGAIDIRASDIPPLSAVRAPEWDALFDRTSGWTGADGVYSIPLSGDERPGSAANGTTFWLFNDTFVGGVLPSGARAPGTVMVNNTNALLTGDLPDPAKMTFFWGTGPGGSPQARVIPNTSSQHWFWPNDGVVVGGKILVFSLRMKPGSGGAFNFATDGISLFADDASNPTPFSTYQQTVAPLYLPANATRGEVIFGQALMPNTSKAGAPFADGYLYVYGVQNDASKKLLAARVLPRDATNFAQYRYWNGSAWVPQIAAAAPLTDRLSSEFSVTPLDDGRYLLVFQLDALGRAVAVRYGASPVGPWGPPIRIWRCPEATLTPNTFVYGAKAHPHLSRPGELLISYHVNTFSFLEHLQNADIYRPRFIRIRTD